MKIYLPFILLLCLSFQVLASSVSIPLDPEDRSKRPAEDLIYQGQRIDSYQALELQSQGVDLGMLSPYESGLWQNTKHSLDQIVLNGQQYSFEEYKRSPTEFFRAVVSSGGARYVLTASLENHTNIIRAGLLRKLGFDISLPKYQNQVSISFNTVQEKADFLEKLGEETLTARARWVARETDDNILHLKDVTIESAELKNVNIHIPVMNRE